MQFNLNLYISRIVVNIFLANGRSDNILAFAELLIYESETSDPTFKVRGFMIRRGVKKDGSEFFSITFPSYSSIKSKAGYQTSFIVENKQLYKEICDFIFAAYKEELISNTPTIEYPDQKKEEESNEDLPF